MFLVTLVVSSNLNQGRLVLVRFRTLFVCPFEFAPCSERCHFSSPTCACRGQNYRRSPAGRTVERRNAPGAVAVRNDLVFLPGESPGELEAALGRARHCRNKVPMILSGARRRP